jgi:phosphate transport system substrate-binding protein
MHKAQTKPENGQAVLGFFDWAYRNGGKLAEDLAYVPMPAAVIGMVEQSWKTIVGPDGKPVWTGSGS